MAEPAADLRVRCRQLPCCAAQISSGLFDALQELAGLRAPAVILEIGCATGIATEPMAQRGHHITCVELGAALAAQARANLAGFPEVSIVCTSFDTWEPPTWGSFDLVYAATAWHWLIRPPSTDALTGTSAEAAPWRSGGNPRRAR